MAALEDNSSSLNEASSGKNEAKGNDKKPVSAAVNKAVKKTEKAAKATATEKKSLQAKFQETPVKKVAPKKAAAKKAQDQPVPEAKAAKKGAGRNDASEMPPRVLKLPKGVIKQEDVANIPMGSSKAEKEPASQNSKNPVTSRKTRKSNVAPGGSVPSVSSTSAFDRDEIAGTNSSVTPAETATEQETVGQTLFSSPLRRITFQIKYRTVPGEALFVTGDHPLLGSRILENAFPLNYLNEDYWYGSIELSDDEGLSQDLSYNYLLQNIDGTFSSEWGTDKVIKVDTIKSDEVVLIDTWNPSSLVENTYYTEPFQEVLLKENFTPVQSAEPEKVTHIFRAKAPLLEKGQALCLVGSIPELGEWQTEKPLLLSKNEHDIWHSVSLDLSDAGFPFNYKYGVYDTANNVFVRYELGSNRVIYDGASDKLTIVSDGFAAIPNNGFHGAGVAIPVFSLRSANSFGVGEFSDLKLMVDWAKKVGLKLVQLLPVNDTTATHQFTDSYPYAAISAFALHPLYLHLPAILNKENQPLLNRLKEKQFELNDKAEVDYVEVMRTKWDLLKEIFPSQKSLTFKSADFHSFFEENKHWLVPYAAFSYFRELNNTADFHQWQSNNQFNAEEINAIAGSPLKADDAISIYYYIQYHLHLQLKDATNYAHKNGIIVKGDIPIGIYRNSCDAWQEPDLFYMDMQAGAPPDDFAVKGQNWGFPTYNWQRMREDGFTWWKKRFRQMSYYFDAFRIDHILGFFRIWSIPMDAVEGILGHFVPAIPVHVNELAARGVTFDFNRLCKAYINDAILYEALGEGKSDFAEQYLLSNEDGTYALKPDFDTQRKVEDYFSRDENKDHAQRNKQVLLDLISNVILLPVDGETDRFHFRIAMYDTASYMHLDGHSKHHLYELYVDYFYRRQDDFWMKEAMLKLPELKRSTNMLICGEDLGMVPDCVPGVMKELAILSLEIQRMPKDPTREFFHPNDAPYLSVVTPSTHDMSTIRGWWEEDRAVTQRFFNHQLGQWGTAPYFCEPYLNKVIVLQHLYSPAMWSIFQLQDLLGISANLRRENPHEERINIPADPKHYWRYRMHLPLEQLLEETAFIAELRDHVVKSGRA